jgi:hypothetical protein
MIFDGFARIRHEMAGAQIEHSCGGMACREQTYAYVRAGSPFRIYWCGHDIEHDSRDWIAAVFIHEMAHEILDLRDLGYYGRDTRTPLNMSRALANARAWENFAAELAGLSW